MEETILVAHTLAAKFINSAAGSLLHWYRTDCGASSPGIQQDSTARLGLLRLLALWSEKLLDSQLFSCELVIVELLRAHPKSRSTKPTYMYIFQSTSSAPLENPD